MTRKALKELLRDAESCHRLTDWERDFCASMWGKLEQYEDDIYFTPRQRETLGRLEQKVYAV